MHACVCVCVHVCVCVCVHVCMCFLHACMHVCVHLCVCFCQLMSVIFHAHTQAHVMLVLTKNDRWRILSMGFSGRIQKPSSSTWGASGPSYKRKTNKQKKDSNASNHSTPPPPLLQNQEHFTVEKDTKNITYHSPIQNFRFSLTPGPLWLCKLLKHCKLVQLYCNSQKSRKAPISHFHFLHFASREKLVLCSIQKASSQMH